MEKPNLYLIKSEFQRQQSGDVIVDLNCIYHIQIFHLDDPDLSPEKHFFGIWMSFPDQKINSKFSTEKLMRAELRNILKAMNADITMADEIMLNVWSEDMQKNNVKVSIS